MKKSGRYSAKPSRKKPVPNRPVERSPVVPGSSAQSRGTVWGVGVFLAALTLAIFGRTAKFDFVNYDDTLYVYENPAVSGGLTLGGLWHAISRGSPANWDPLTTISHMVDCQLYGLHAGGHHLTNVVLHTVSVVLLFLVLRRMTGNLWPSAFVAAVFAIHPLRAESVAWVTERKDVLSGVFFMLTLGAYARYVRRPGLPSYGLVLLLFALGLMSKAMLVTLPFLLLLLDWWPLRRFGPATDEGGSNQVRWRLNRIPRPWRLWVEKIPLLALSLVSVVVAGLAQSHASAIETGEPFPLSLRLSNALHSTFVYLWQTFDPSRLAVYYPYPTRAYPVWECVLLVAAFAALTAAAFFCRNRRPYVLVGWLWYLGMLTPVIGVVQLGTQAEADRYTYLPQIGLCMALIWLADGAWSGWRQRRLVLGVLGMLIVGVLSIACARQVSFWQDSETLWKRELDCGFDNALSHYELGVVYGQRGLGQLAAEQYRQAVAIKPEYSEALNNLGNLLLQAGRVDEAIACFRKALQSEPRLATAYWNIGMGRLQQGRVDDAITNFEQAIIIKPDYLSAHLELATALLAKGRVDEAMRKLEAILRFAPNFAEAHNDLGCILLNEGRLEEALSHFQQAVSLKPDYPEAQNSLAHILILQKRPDEAITRARGLLQTHPDDPGGHQNLGSGLLEKQRLDEAVAEFRTALKIRPGFVPALGGLDDAAWMLATSPDPQARNGARAVNLALEVEQSYGGKNPRALAALAAAYAEAGRFSEAATAAQRALDLLAAQSNSDQAAKLRKELAAYQTGTPFRDTERAGVPGSAGDP
jgi:Tfp pilus assembly protein PilF